MQREEDILLVFLAYLDDSGSQNKNQQFQLMTAVLIPDSAFRNTELHTAASLVAYIPDDQAEEFRQGFKEFKGSELFGGYGAFEKIEESVRFQIIKYLLGIVRSRGFPIIFGGMNKREWEDKTSKSGRMFAYGGAHIDEICFRTCLKGVGHYIEHNASTTFALVIVDDYKDRVVKDRLRSAFLNYRERMDLVRSFSAMPFLHDDMYFGDSRFSIGIQLADLCGFLIEKHLENDSNPNIIDFYSIIEPQVMYSWIEPEGKPIHAMPIAGVKI